VNVLVHLPVWLGSRLSCWKARFKKLRGDEFPWDELCGEDEEETFAQFEERCAITDIGRDLDGESSGDEDSWAVSDSDGEGGEDVEDAE
jgi:hypothetical protein